MIWQDVAMSVASIVFALAMIRMLSAPDDQLPPLGACIGNAFALATCCVAQVTLGLIITASMSMALAVSWVALAARIWRR